MMVVDVSLFLMMFLVFEFGKDFFMPSFWREVLIDVVDCKLPSGNLCTALLAEIEDISYFIFRLATDCK